MACTSPLCTVRLMWSLAVKLPNFFYNVLHLDHDLAFHHMACLSHVYSLLFHMITISLNPSPSVCRQLRQTFRRRNLVVGIRFPHSHGTVRDQLDTDFAHIPVRRQKRSDSPDAFFSVIEIRNDHSPDFLQFSVLCKKTAFLSTIPLPSSVSGGGLYHQTP